MEMEIQNIDDTQMQVKKPVAENLKKLEVGESEVFPIIQIDTIKTTIQRLQMVSALRFSTKSNKADRVLIVVRES